MSRHEETSPLLKGKDRTSATLPYHHKLFLCAAFAANEMVVVFQGMYQVPLLRTMGVPFSLVSFYPIIEGPAAMIFMTLMPNFSDRGPKHRQRKIAVVLIICIIMLIGITMVTVSNLMLVYCETQYQSSHEDNATFVVSAYETFGIANACGQSPATNSSTANGTTASTTPVLEQDAESSVFDLPVTGVLGLVGFALMDLSYDNNVAAIRACVLACSPKAEHTSILILALVLSANGGCITCVLGIIDLSQVFDLGMQRGSLVAQTTAQMLLLFVAVVLLVFSTVITSLLNIRRLNNYHLHKAIPSADLSGNGQREEYQNQTSNLEDYESASSDMKEQYGNTTTESTKQSSDSEDTKCSDLDRTEKLDKVLFVAGRLTPVLLLGKQQRSCSTTPRDDDYGSSSLGIRGPEPKTLSTPREVPARDVCCGLTKLDLNFGLVCVVTYLGFSSFTSYSMYVSNFLGSVVAGGNFSAPIDSEARKAYEYGVQKSADGLMILFLSYVVMGLLHDKLLKRFGPKFVFCVPLFLMATCITLLLATHSYAAFYVTCIAFSLVRASFYSIPFIVANDYIHEKMKIKGMDEKDDSLASRILGILTGMLPLYCFTLRLLSGPLISLTSYNGAPLVVACVCIYVACVLFLFHGRL